MPKLWQFRVYMASFVQLDSLHYILIAKTPSDLTPFKRTKAKGKVRFTDSNGMVWLQVLHRYWMIQNSSLFMWLFRLNFTDYHWTIFSHLMTAIAYDYKSFIYIGVHNVCTRLCQTRPVAASHLAGSCNYYAYIVIVDVSSKHRLTKHTAFKLQLEIIHKWNSSHLYKKNYTKLAASCGLVYIFCKH